MVFHEGAACKHAEQKIWHRRGQGAELSAAGGEFYSGHGTTSRGVSFFIARSTMFARAVRTSRFFSPPHLIRLRIIRLRDSRSSRSDLVGRSQAVLSVGIPYARVQPTRKRVESAINASLFRAARTDDVRAN